MVTLLSRIKGPFGGFGIDKIPFGYQCLQQQKIVNEKWKKDLAWEERSCWLILFSDVTINPDCSFFPSDPYMVKKHKNSVLIWLVFYALKISFILEWQMASWMYWKWYLLFLLNIIRTRPVTELISWNKLKPNPGRFTTLSGRNQEVEKRIMRL